MAAPEETSEEDLKSLEKALVAATEDAEHLRCMLFLLVSLFGSLLVSFLSCVLKRDDYSGGEEADRVGEA
jgi:hypothetical protein